MREILLEPAIAWLEGTAKVVEALLIQAKCLLSNRVGQCKCTRKKPCIECVDDLKCIQEIKQMLGE